MLLLSKKIEDYTKFSVSGIVLGNICLVICPETISDLISPCAERRKVTTVLNSLILGLSLTSAIFITLPNILKSSFEILLSIFTIIGFTLYIFSSVAYFVMIWTYLNCRFWTDTWIMVTQLVLTLVVPCIGLLMTINDIIIIKKSKSKDAEAKTQKSLKSTTENKVKERPQTIPQPKKKLDAQNPPKTTTENKLKDKPQSVQKKVETKPIKKVVK